MCIRDRTIAVCQNGTQPTITFTGANGTAPYTFTYNINGGANLTVTSNASGVATVTAATTADGTFNYNLVSVQDASSTTCSNTQTGTATVVVNRLPIASVLPSNIIHNCTVCLLYSSRCV